MIDADIRFYFDPVCPFAWMTSKWVRLVVAQRDYTVDWRFIALRLVNANVDYDTQFPPEYRELHIAGTKFLGQISSTPVGFVTGKGSPIAKALSDAVNELIANGDYTKIFDKWGVGGTEITKSTLNPATTF